MTHVSVTRKLTLQRTIATLMQRGPLTRGRVNSTLASPASFPRFLPLQRWANFTACAPITTSIPELSARRQKPQRCRESKTTQEVSGRGLTSGVATALPAVRPPFKSTKQRCNKRQQAWFTAAPSVFWICNILFAKMVRDASRLLMFFIYGRHGDDFTLGLSHLNGKKKPNSRLSLFVSHLLCFFLSL